MKSIGYCCSCDEDYVDIFIEMTDVDADLLDQLLHGRYCGNDLSTLPHLLISMHNVLIVGFDTDERVTREGFYVEYEFIDACKCHEQS